jgi:hypothetical protein
MVKKPGIISVLAPVRHSVGRIVGSVEVAGGAAPPKRDER